MGPQNEPPRPESQQPVPSQGYGDQPNSTQSGAAVSPKTGKLMLVVIILVLTLLLVAAVLYVFLSGRDTSSSGANQETSQSTVLEPASAIGIEQINSSLSQDLSGQDDTKDFAPDDVGDKSLGL